MLKNRSHHERICYVLNEKQLSSEQQTRRIGFLLIGALCWILCLEWFIGQAIAQAAWTTPYSIIKNYISDLGAVHCHTFTIAVNSTYTYRQYICSPLHNVLNDSSILLGILIIGGAILLRPIWPQTSLVVVGLVFIALYGLGRIIVGFVPEDTNLKLHILGSAGFLFGNIGVILLGISCWNRIRWKALVSFIVGAIGSISFVLLLEAPQLGIGLLERLASYPQTLWLVTLGLTVIISHRTSRTAIL
jgi:hypothetical membrane protein